MDSNIFGGLLIKIMIIVVVVVLTMSIVLRHPMFEMLLFAMALAVALSPELLPAIFTITLARGAKDMAKRGVIVKRFECHRESGKYGCTLYRQDWYINRGGSAVGRYPGF